MSRPSILISADEYKVVDELQLVIKEISGLYQRGRQLVQVIRSENASDSGSLAQASKEPQIVAVPKSNLRTMLTRHCSFLKVKLRSGEVELDNEGQPVLIPAHPPEWAVNTLFDQPVWPIPSLDAVVESPVFLRSGRILQQPGYDPRSGLFYSPDSKLDMPLISEEPDSSEIEEAKDLIEEVVCDFPFENDSHRSGWFAGVLSYLCRWAYTDGTPLFLINKSAPGIGGSRLSEAAMLICAGRKGKLYTVAADNQQEKKQIDEVALNGNLLVYIDNISESAPFGTGELDKALTQDVWDCSVKYKDGTFRQPLLCVWWANGCNVQYRRGVDTFRRTQMIRLISKLERPQERTDLRHPDLLDWVAKNRGKILWAFLTLVRSYHNAGCPQHSLKTWGGFESWGRIVRECLVFHGYADPYLAFEALVQLSDPAQLAKRQLLLGWEQMCKAAGHPEGMTSLEAQRLLESEMEERRLVPSKQMEHEILIEAFGELCKKGAGRAGVPDSAQIGYLLRACRDRIFAGRRIVCTDPDKDPRGRIWTVEGIAQ
jgi:hypothetical protein